MFFYISKVFWFFAQPSNLIILLFTIGIVLYFCHKRQTAIRLITFSIVTIALAGLSPMSNLMMLSLEEQYAKPAIENLDAPDGIIVLGGMLDTLISERRNETTLNNGAERLTEAAKMALRFPKSRILVTGGVGALIYRGRDEATMAKKFLIDLGIDKDRIQIETQSKNTWQNAVFSKKLIKPKAGENWLLITSAFHMPRSMGVFRAAGFPVTPWPVDYRTRGMEDAWRFSARPSKAWRNIDVAVKEWVGYIAYSLSGRLK